MKSFKVLYIINGLGFSKNTGIGGSDKRFIEMVRNLKEIDTKGSYDILTTSSGKNLFENSEGIKTTYHEITQPTWWPDYLNNYLVGRILSYLYATYASIKKEAENFAQYDYFFATSDFFFDLLPGYIFAKKHKKKLFCMVHHYIKNPWERGGNKFINILMYISQHLSIKFISFAGDVVYFYDTPEGKMIQQKFLSHNKSYFVKNGVSTKMIDNVPSQEKIYDACFAGGIRHSKGILEFAPIWKKVVERFPKAKFAVVGGGSQEIMNTLRTEIKKHDMTENIELIGPVSSEKVPEYMKKSKLFLFPSHEEGWGIVVCEAMYCELPTICYDLPAYKIFGNALDKFKVGNYEELSNKVIDYLKDDKKIENKGVEVKKVAAQFTWPNIAKEEFDIYKKYY